MASLNPARFRGGLVGLAVGDAIGTTVEFKPPGTFERVTNMVGGGPFGLPAGAWTDDTSMALCLAESLVKRGGFDPVDQLQRYVRWYREGHWSSTGACFDIGNATRAALERFERTREPYPGDADETAAGNAPLMRLAPVALAYAGDPSRAVRFAGLSARTTHGAPEAVDACRYFAGLLLRALHGDGKEAVLNSAATPLHPKVAAVARGSFRTKQPPEIRGGGYVVDALEAALWALHSTETFEDGVLAAVNLGDDADTTAAIYGQLAGALYGVDAIPARWREKLFLGSRIVEVADALARMAERTRAEAGPVDGSLHVQPGRLIAGPSPTSAAQLDALRAADVTCFVGLTDDGATHKTADTTHLNLAIRDDGVRTDWRIVATLSALHLAMSAGELVYLHGDTNRTGMVLAALLVGNGAPSTEILHLLATLRAASIGSGDVLERLRAGGPVVVAGPGPGQRVQALAERDDRVVRVEVLDPAYWQTGPALHADQQRALHGLGLRREEGMWAYTARGGDEEVTEAAELVARIRELLGGASEQ